MKRNSMHILFVAIVMLTIFASCRKELCYEHFPTADIGLSWEREWERDYGQSYSTTWDGDRFGIGYEDLKPNIPEWVVLVRYADNETPNERFLSPEGGKLTVSASPRQSFLLYNGDTEYIILSDIASLNDARASATQRSRSSISYISERHPNARTTNPPDILYSAFIENVPSIQNHEVKPIPVKMQPLVYTYLIRYEFEHGIEHVALARGALGGMAESVYLRDGITSEETAIILYDCDIRPYGCETYVRSFGIPGFPDEYYGRFDGPTKERPFTLNLEVMLKNGKTVEFNYDISDQMANQPRGGVITVSGLRIEDEQNASSSGFEVDINDWGDHEVIDLPIGGQKPTDNQSNK